jgi:hypothetical protein
MKTPPKPETALITNNNSRQPPTGTNNSNNRHQQLQQQLATVPDLPAITGNNSQKQPMKKISGQSS